MAVAAWRCARPDIVNDFIQFVGGVLQCLTGQMRGGVRIAAQGANAPQQGAVQGVQAVYPGFHLLDESGIMGGRGHREILLSKADIAKTGVIFLRCTETIQ